MRLSTIAFPCDEGDVAAGPGIAAQCAAACDGLRGLLAQRWGFNARTGLAGGLLRWADEPTRAGGEAAVLARLAALHPFWVAPRLRTYALARAPARSMCAPLPNPQAGGWDHYEI